MPMRVYAKVIAAILLLGMSWAGCDLLSLEDDSDEIRSLIETNQERWEEANLQAYQFSYDQTVGGSTLEDVFVVVRDAEIDSASVDGEPVDDASSFLTIDGVYDALWTAFEQSDRGQFSVNFNGEIGYPTRYRVGVGDSTPGEAIIVSDFEVLEDGSVQ